MTFIITEIRDRIAYIILNRPEKRNALNAEFVNEIKDCIKSYSSDNRVRALIIKSSGDVFCAGADLAYLQRMQEFSYEENLADSQNLAELFKLIYTFPKPVISLVNGAALAGGCGLATVCDMCFATPGSTFGYTEARIGFIPAIVMVFLRKKVGEAIGKKILFTGEVFNSGAALEYGLVTGIIEPEIIEEDVHKWVLQMIHNSSAGSLTLIKEMYEGLQGLSLDEALELACKTNALARNTDDCKTGISAFLNKQKQSW